MKKLYLLLLLSLAFWANLPAQIIPPILFDKIYGNAGENRPTAVKAFNDGIYVAGYQVIAGDEYATFTKFNLATGALVWEKCFELHTHINDFDYEPTQDELFIVGHTTPFSSTFDNESFLARISGNGNLMDFQRFEHDGREQFQRIVRHPNPVNPNAPFYILGVKNPSPVPSQFEDVILYNVDKQNSVIVWGRQYSITPPENEFARGLIPQSNGNLILTGNDIANNGVLLQVDGANGNPLNAFIYPHVLDIYDGIELPNSGGFVVIVGEDFSVHEAFVMVLNPALNTPPGTAPGLRFSNIINFKDIWLDQLGKLYVIGESKNLASPFTKNYQVVHKLSVFIHPGQTILSVDWARYLEDQFGQETAYSNGNISVTPAHDRIFYADARLNTPTGFGSWDMLIGSYDLNLGSPSPCVHDFPFPNTVIAFTQNVLPVTTSNVTPLNVTNPPIIKNCMLGCHDFCGMVVNPCPCDFTWTAHDCFEVTFDASCPNPMPGIYTYQWDFDCSGGTPDLVTNNPLASNTYPCGGGLFNACVTITDPMGTICMVTHPVTVPATCCGQVTTAFVECTDDPYVYTFCVVAVDPQTANSCTYTLLNNTPLTTLSGVNYDYLSVPGGVKITGMVTVADPIPLTLNWILHSVCTCISPLGATFTCDKPIAVATVCCKKIIVPSTIVCQDAPTLDVPIQTLGNLQNIGQVTWYVMPLPASGICPPSPWGGMPYQDNFTSNLEPLHLYPASLPGDVCVYAVVHLNDGPCMVLTSNSASVHLCGPSTYSVNSYDYCYTAGIPVVPGALILLPNSPGSCSATIQWFDPNNQLVQTGGTIYVPTVGLSMTNPTVDCYQDFLYRAHITDDCGQRDFYARVRLYSDDAPAGTLALAPTEQLPLCLGGDATLEFTPGCVDSLPLPPKWSWCYSLTGSNWQPLPNGTQSLHWNTNALFQDTWYAVKATNGVCPTDLVAVKIDLRPAQQINYFIAQYNQPCDPTGVYMEVGYTPPTPDPNCPVTVEWYKDGVLLNITGPPAPNPASYTYFTGGGPLLAGNYYCIVQNCCESDTSAVIRIPPPCFAEAGGPCFICDNEQVILCGAVFNLPPGVTCTYQWTTPDGHIVGPSNTLCITVDAPGHYVFTATCNGCVKTASYDLKGCTSGQLRGECGLIIPTDEAQPQGLSPLRLFPNPTTGDISVEWTGDIPHEAQLFLTDLSGRVLRTLIVPDGATHLTTSLGELPPGMYFIKIQAVDRLFAVAKVVKE